ncbi:MAG: outer membrane protein assembly factor BamB family protein, partial [Planctomycetota bacterium]
MVLCRATARSLRTALLGLTLVLTGSTGRADDSRPARRLLDAAGARGGLVVHVGCRDGRLTAALWPGNGYVVQGLDPHAANVAKARAHVDSLGLYGRVSINTFDGKRLPYVDNLVNLLVAESLGDVPMEEVMRVLAPGGAAYLGSGGAWTKTVKPWPDDIDEWTHFQHGPDNNAVAQDDVVGPPRRMQWLAGPAWTRHHHADKGTDPTIRAVVSSQGRLYYTVDETESSNRQVPGKWFLAARDAFSGVLLWKVPIRTTAFDRRLERIWRELIADGDEVYAQLGTHQPLSALDGATGTVIREYEGTEDLQEVIKHEGTLFVVTRQHLLTALEAASGRLLWRWDPGDEGPLVPLTLAASDGRVFIRTDRSIRCLSADEGTTRWRFVPEGAGKRTRLKWPREKLLVGDGVVLASYGGKDPAVLNRDKYQYLGSHPRVHQYGAKLAALSAQNGSVLWTTDYLPGLESMPGEIYISDGLVWLGPDFSSPRDLHTGEVQSTRPVLESLWTAGHHYRCYPGKATRKYVLTAKRGIEMFDLAGDGHSRNNWVRATCRVGVTPCNGLLYVPPHSCGCYMEAKLFGFWALAPERKSEAEIEAIDEGERLERGPAYGRIGKPPLSAVDAKDWWTYRADSTRSGSTSLPVPSTLKQVWQTDLGGRLSAATVAEGKLFVARIDAHTVHALDAESGNPLWQFTTGGRVDSPPTVYGGLALFGSRDGWVYCLRAVDGDLQWRFLAAPREMGAVAYGQIESLWPVHGSVLVHNQVAYVAAGRSSYLDGGIMLYGLEPATGKLLWATRLASEHAGALAPPLEDEKQRLDNQFAQNHTDYKTFLAPDKSDAFSMTGALADVMVADGESIFMRHLRFDGKLTQQHEKLPHLFSTSSLLDSREHNRSYWAFGTADFSRTPVAYPWIVTKSMAVPYGVTLAFDDKTVWGVRRGGKGREHEYAVFAAPRPDPSQRESLLPDFAERSGQKKPLREHWVAEIPIRPRAMIRAGDKLFVGGMTDRFDPNDPEAPVNAAYAGQREGLLRVVSSIDGKT